jgi:hypothetical protein
LASRAGAIEPIQVVVASARCPLCDAPVHGDESLREHLAGAHDLVDDPGKTTRLHDLDVEMFLPPPVSTPRGEALTIEPPSLRVYEPDHDDERWKPFVVGVGGVVLLAAVAAAKAAMGA